MANLQSVGRADAIMLDDISEKTFVDNLRVRYDADKVYTYIGEVLISLNPYKQLGIYNTVDMDKYHGAALYQREPHIFAVAESAYSTMRRNDAGCCIIVAGESGAGKTEASKQVMQYIAHVCGKGQEVAEVKQLLLASNPLLEAFGNACTARNDNSSRFGKYMDLVFDYKFEPAGGSIQSYLLEKARVVRHAETDRNFHIFYQLLAGADAGMLKSLGLSSSVDSYTYLGKGAKPALSDKEGYREVQKALTAIGFSAELQNTLHSLVAAILLLGQVEFEPKGEHSTVKDSATVAAVAARLGTDAETLVKALTYRVVAARGEVAYSELNAERATYSRDALAKALYNELFMYLVANINKSIATRCVADTATHVIGVLDIYGFEIFPVNGFEQFCINYCNEKLQQLFIELVMKREQAEYAAEGITWVDVPFFDNKAICDMVENPKDGVIVILDEHSNKPGGTDASFYSHLESALAPNERFSSHAKDPSGGCRRDIDFKIRHFAGDVVYTVTNFLDKNQDALYQDVKRMLYECTTPGLKDMFPGGADELTQVHKNPMSAAMGFKVSMTELTELLTQKEPFYVRCIKPNNNKRAGQFDESLIDHQVRYLGLMENLRVRRAGYCNRQVYEVFVARYKMLSAKTWPVWRKDMKEGATILIDTLRLQKAVAFGKTKIFIKEPSTLYLIEQKREEAIPRLVAKIQAAWRGLLGRRLAKRVRAYAKICRWWRSMKSRNYFAAVAKTFAGVAGRRDLGKRLQWPPAIPGAEAFEDLGRRVHMRWWTSTVLKSLQPRKAEILLKMPAFTIMKGRRSNWGVGVEWIGNYCAKEDARVKFGAGVSAIFEKNQDSKVEFSSNVLLLNKKGKQVSRVIVISSKNVYVLDPKKFKIADKLMVPIATVESITVSTGEDQLVVLQVPGGTDLIVKLSGDALSAELVCAVLRGCPATISVNVTDNIKVNLKGKETTIQTDVADTTKSEFKASKLGVRLVTRKSSVMGMKQRLSPESGGGATQDIDKDFC